MATTTILLIRHAEHELQGRVLVGRMPGVPLGPKGIEQAQRLARRLAGAGIGVIQSGPLERARRTAAVMAETLGVSSEIVDAVDEIDCGEWTGKSFAELDGDPRWAEWNRHRVLARAPGGESMDEVQERIVGHLGRLLSDHPGRRVAIVSHGDVIRAALLHVLGMSMDDIERIEVAPASVSTVALGDWGGKVITLNERIGA